MRSGIVKLTSSLGQAGVDQIALTGQIAGLTAELTKLESRRRLAEADAAAIPFPGKPMIDQLRQAVGELETAVARATAVNDLISKITAAIEAWKA
ncbi:hypothetical protein [Sphingomonas sp. Leaf339]|uniref:hypothetical protein n=1 Tax=Sphingomonas sp. Leaf339 TaxID=1736343 RepID=UPI0012E37B86|nr:hypothetical protein [Sphingomonas sp. Leaf339]